METYWFLWERKRSGWRFIVQDSGCGMDEKELEALKNKLKEYDRNKLSSIAKHGIGMVNIYRRLRLFYELS